MKLKNTLGVVIGTLLASASAPVFAQGQGAVEGEIFINRFFSDSTREHKKDHGNLYGGTVGYFLTDDVELALSHGHYRSMRMKDRPGRNTGIRGEVTSLTSLYHFGTPGVGLRPYISAGIGHQSLGQGGNGRDRTTQAIIGAGLKYYPTENFFLRAGVDGLYNFDRRDTEWQVGLGAGLNFGGSAGRPATVAQVTSIPDPVTPPVAACTDSDGDGVCDDIDRCPDTPYGAEVDADGCSVQVIPVQVELDVKFDFDKALVKQQSQGDIQNLADFMHQHPQTNTRVEGHTDSVGNDAYNQRLSERRANAVKQVLVNQYGIDPARVDSAGYGKTRPIADNSTEEGRALNRRVEAKVEAEKEVRQ